MTVHDARFASDHTRKLEAYKNNLASSVGGEVQVTEEISLEPELINSLYRRGRRRLRDIQTNCGVNVWLDKLRGVLHLSGSKASVAAAKNLIAGLGGPRKRISAAMWAELLRTRKLQSGAEAAVSRIQLQSGCRIHVERGSQEVHLFGDMESVATADALLKELDQHCMEETIKLDAESFNSVALQEIANSCGVTLQTGKDYICILGLRDSVRKAVATVNERREDLELLSDLPAPLAHERPVVKEFNKSPAPVPMPIPDVAKNDGKIKNKICPTCGACPFCASCGHPVAFFDENDASGFSKYALGNTCTPAVYINSDYNAQQMWQQMPFMPQEFGMNGGVVDNSTQMAFMVPNAQNVPVCFVPAQMMPARRQN
jgi:hypothetical protein